MKDNGGVNVSPHHQRPSKYPWPGLASRAVMVVGIVLIVLLVLALILDPFSNDQADEGSAGTRTTQGV